MKYSWVRPTFLSVWAAVGGVVGFLWGEVNAVFIAYCVMMLVDYIMGLLLAGIWHKSPKTANGAIESNAAIKGLVKKGVCLLVVLVAHMLDMALKMSVIRDGVIFAFMAAELISIMETAGLMGVPFPSWMKRALELLNAKSEPPADEKGDDLTDVHNA